MLQHNPSQKAYPEWSCLSTLIANRHQLRLLRYKNAGKIHIYGVAFQFGQHIWSSPIAAESTSLLVAISAELLALWGQRWQSTSLHIHLTSSHENITEHVVHTEPLALTNQNRNGNRLQVF